MTPTINSSPFVAKAHFLPENKWLNKYQTFWFASEKLSPPNAGYKDQFKSLKQFIDSTVINKTFELIVFDNRPQYVSEYSLPEKKGNNIICRYVNGVIVEDFFHKLSFLEWTFDQGFLLRLARSFDEIGKPSDQLPKGETELVRELLHEQKWKNTLKDYKKSGKPLENSYISE